MPVLLSAITGAPRALHARRALRRAPARPSGAVSARAEGGQKMWVRVCNSKTCGAAGSGAVLAALEEKLAGRDDVLLEMGGCLGRCKDGPNCAVLPEGGSYRQQTAITTLAVDEVVDAAQCDAVVAEVESRLSSVTVADSW
mmetsp:Transcript_9912/g.34558  ORF Transcript_9912/g.34558 Transcript_9912/m.34558 type:complete len:141 (+) Transcript_9912:39-461(+)